jgi:Reverse transcriptase (RNA-dependent DNA polymerase)
VDECIYHKFSESKFVFLALYIDDILLASNDKNMMYETKKFLFNYFDMKDLGEASYVLGLKIHRDQNKGILELSQQAYINKILKRYGMKNCKPGNTPVAKGDEFSLDQCPKNRTREIRNASDSICFLDRKSYVCSRVYASGYYVYHSLIDISVILV